MTLIPRSRRSRVGKLLSRPPFGAVEFDRRKPTFENDECEPGSRAFEVPQIHAKSHGMQPVGSVRAI
jgi:hypothetical protein